MPDPRQGQCHNILDFMHTQPLWSEYMLSSCLYLCTIKRLSRKAEGLQSSVKWISHNLHRIMLISCSLR